MKYNSRKIAILLCIAFYIMNMYPIKIYADKFERKIVVIGSYDMQNEWEKDIVSGFNSVLAGDSIINLEYLDANSSNSPDYYNSFLNLLNLKYNNDHIDCIFLMDDEAVRFMSSHLLDENAFCYKKPMFFVGVNELPNFSVEEGKYISGILDIENSLNSVDVILNTQPNLKTIYLLTDESQYCKSMERDILDIPLYNYGINVEILKITDIDKLKSTLANLNKSEAAILLSGTYSTLSRDTTITSKEVINYIKSITDTPIYTTLYSYVRAGAIGGIVNDGRKLGKMGANLLNKMMLQGNTDERYVITPSENSLNIPVFNFKAVREYGINPLKCPPNSTFLEKGRFDMLLPIGMVYLIYGSSALIVILIIILCILLIRNKREANLQHLKLIESKERESIKTDYIIIMAHEFRTPLNIIKSITDLLIMQVSKGNITKEYLLDKFALIQKNSNRLNRTINHSIDVSKLESGMMGASFKMYNVVEVVEDVTNTIIDFANKNDVDVVFDTTEEEIFTAIDKKAIDRIMLNLLSNAVKSINGKGSIIVRCSRNKDTVFIIVKDTGVGISTEAKQHIFEKFYQVRNSYSTRNFEGNGLGLYIVKKLVELHKGTIILESQLGVGTTFVIQLPISIVDEYPDKNDEDDINYLAKLEFSDMN